jgi:adenylosuccinate synthase
LSFEYETGRLPSPVFEDQTNVDNHFQGSLRFAPLDLDKFKKRVDQDFDRLQRSFPAVKKGLAMTCVDQFFNNERLPVETIIDGKSVMLRNAEQLFEDLAANIKADVANYAFGTREFAWAQDF